METVRIIFKNGAVITAEKNGDSLITNTKPTFPANLSIVTIQGETETKVIQNAQLTECASVDGRYWFTFTVQSEEEIMIEKVRFLEDCLMEMSEEVYK